MSCIIWKIETNLYKCSIALFNENQYNLCPKKEPAHIPDQTVYESAKCIYKY